MITVWLRYDYGMIMDDYGMITVWLRYDYGMIMVWLWYDYKVYIHGRKLTYHIHVICIKLQRRMYVTHTHIHTDPPRETVYRLHDMQLVYRWACKRNIPHHFEQTIDIYIYICIYSDQSSWFPKMIPKYICWIIFIWCINIDI